MDSKDSKGSKSVPAKIQEPLVRLQRLFGYTYEELDKVLRPMALTGQEPTGSMGYDAPLAVLSTRPQLLFHYFKQRFAQVTNPPIDAIREQLVTSIETWIGTEGNLLAQDPSQYRKLRLDYPVLSNAVMDHLNRLNNLNSSTGEWKIGTVPILFPVTQEGRALEEALEETLRNVDLHIQQGCQLIVLSDRGVGPQRAAIPSLLATSAVHQHLIRTGKRTKVSLIVASGEPREVHHFAALLGFGANAVYPYLAYASLPSLREDGTVSIDKLEDNFVHAASKGILKIMSKMGISVLQSYIGAQIFEAIGAEWI